MDVLDNPFHLLGATTRDDRVRLQELAEEKSLLNDPEKIEHAHTILATPVRRIAAEAAWMPGLAPAKAAELVGLLGSYPSSIIDFPTLPPLAKANLLASALLRLSRTKPPEWYGRWIDAVAKAFENVKLEEVLIALNEDRKVAGFPVITDHYALMKALEERRTFCRERLRGCLDMLPSRSLVTVLTKCTEGATNKGKHAAPVLLEDVVDIFEEAAAPFFDSETGNIQFLIDELRKNVAAGAESSRIDECCTKLEQTVRNWDAVAQPIQVVARSRGRRHDHSFDVAGMVRSLAIDLTNQHQLPAISRRLTSLAQEVFAEVDEITQQANDDAELLDEIIEEARDHERQSKERAAEHARAITYSTEWGLVVKSRFSIAPDGIQWNGDRWALEKIHRLRWGGTRHYVNGVYTGTTYTIQFGGKGRNAQIKLKKDDIYHEIVGHLWRAVGVRLLIEMLASLKAGNSIPFGTATVRDTGMELERATFFGRNPRQFFTWQDLRISNESGAFHVFGHPDKRFAVHLEYGEVDNVHVLEAALRALWKKGGTNLSRVFA